MRQVYKGNVSIPLHVVEQFLAVNGDPKAKVEDMATAAAKMVASLKEAKRRIDEGLDDSNLTVCIGKFAYVNAHDARKFLSGDIPAITLFRKSRDNHDMPLYHKFKPSEYIKRAAIRKKVKDRETKTTNRRSQKANATRR